MWPQPIIRSVDARIPGRVDLLRGFGNAINPWVAAEYIQSSVEAHNLIQ